MKQQKLNSRVITEKFGEENNTCKDCGSMLELDSDSCTNEGCSSTKKVKETKILKRKSRWLLESKKLFLEIRDKVSESELVQTWEDLFVDSGIVSVEELASWVNATEEAVAAALPSWLVVDKHGHVVEKGNSVPPPPM
jgi:hypothetical protein